MAKPWLWKSRAVILSCFMFFATMDWAGSMDQLTTAWTPAALTLVRRAERSVALLS